MSDSESDFGDRRFLESLSVVIFEGVVSDVGEVVDIDSVFIDGVDAWTRQPPHFFFFLDKARKLSKIVSVLQSASFERFDVSRMRDF